MNKDEAREAAANEPDATERARAWLEANTPLRWVDEPDPECPDEPLEALNRRPQLYAERMAAFLESEAPRIRADERKKTIGQLAQKLCIECASMTVLTPNMILYTVLPKVAKEMTEVK